MSQLALLVDGVITKLFPLHEGSLTIGRSPGCDVCIDDPSVSNNHAAIFVAPSEFLDGHQEIFIEDQCSRNGTLVNDRLVQRSRLCADDVIRIGWNTFKVLNGRAENGQTTVMMVID